MASEDTQQSPWTRPGFLAAAVVVVGIAVAAIVLSVLALTREDDPGDTAAPAPDPSASQTSGTDPAPASASPSPAAEEETEDSVCGLSGVETDGRLSTAPEAEWEYQGTTAYPVSTEFGPAETSDEGYRYCFQHTPEGALLAASNAVTQATDPATVGPWLEYFLADGPAKEQILAQGGELTSAEGVRLSIAGFRMLGYDGETATVDVAMEASGQGQQIILSAVYTLAWEDGDWKLQVTDPTVPFDVSTLPDLSGYVAWGA
ncbi:hypothetical protein DT076_07915 [Desertihabitans brevis]|uniref:DUF8175 domain-containing protein n=1 Tax=Desertihabitans brevis TaxID=2268447 RepID=A0A367YVU8_9ACTN|nr:hypothetical protein [Desertihabitans brevis]RCK69938.1 hypothetical protein DT076_07915 [Desertihabitans brevis]